MTDLFLFNKQLPLFACGKEQDLDSSPSKDEHVWELYVDGASRNNPGPSGIGIHLSKDGTSILNKGYFAGIKTNNQAEYLALIVGAMHLEEYIRPFDIIEVNADSQLLIRQLEGTYKIKNPALQLYASAARSLLNPFNVRYNHILRDKNHIADALANKGIDQKVVMPAQFITKLKEHEILL